MTRIEKHKIIGIYCMPSEYEHDHSVCLINNGEIIKYYHLERISGVKYDNKLLEKQNLIFNENHINNTEWESSYIAFADSFTPLNFKIQDISISCKEPSINNSVIRNIKYSSRSKDQLNVFSHELCHLYSCVPFYGKFPKKSLGIHIDGGASYSNHSAWTLNCDGNNIDELLDGGWKLHRDINNFSQNHLTQIILGLFRRPNADLSAPGKLMGLASYGTYQHDLYDWLEKNGWFYDTNPHKFLKSCESYFHRLPNLQDPTDPLLVNIAKTIQVNFTNRIIQYMKQFKKYSNSSTLVYAGGAALNIVTNSKIVQELNFEDIWIPPCCNDTGLSIGAASIAMGSQQYNYKHSPFLCNSELDNQYPEDENLIHDILNLLLNNKVIGIAFGKGESGPRALGHRSIIALPTYAWMKDKVSIQIKKREPYRPLAPILLEKVAKLVLEDYFNMKSNELMLYEYKVKPCYHDVMQAVIHVDGTVRAQIIKEVPFWSEKKELIFWKRLLEHLWEIYAIPALINTSFNDAGQPIVNSKEQAISTANRLGLDAILIGNKLKILK